MRSTAWVWVIIVIIIIAGVWYAATRGFFSGPSSTATSTPQTVNNTVAYSCANGKTISAMYMSSEVMLSLSDGRSLTLPQAVSASGIRYEMATSSTNTNDIVFWSEGNDAFITENGTTTYTNCVGGTVSQSGGANTFTDQGNTFSFSYPTNLSVSSGEQGYTQSWSENATTSGLILAEIDIPQSYEAGTNFGDAKFTVGTSADPSAVATCLVNPFGGPPQATTTAATIDGTAFTKIHYTDVGAGNYYDTTSYRTVRDNQCYAIEYTIHYANFANFPAGSVKQFNEAPLTNTLDSVAQSFKFLQ